MARLAAKENLLFYPTGIPVVQLIAGNISPAGDEGGSILDPCCGQGEAVALLGSALGLTTYGNELHPARAGQAKLRLDHCLNGPREFLVSGGLFNVVFNNPPYDFALSGQRMEFENIVQDVALLVNGGLGVWVIPRHTLTRELCGFLGDNLRQINVRKLPAPYYDRFKQVVVFGVKHLRSTSAGPSNYIGSVQLANLVAGDDLPTLQAGEFSYRFYTAGNRIDRFSLAFPEAARVLAEIETAGIQNGEGWQALFGPKDTAGKRFQPLLPLGPGHMAFVIASGLVDGTEVTIDNQRHILKGSARKQVVVTEETQVDEETQATRLTRWERERFVSAISAFNLHDGTLIEYDNQRQAKQFGQFLLAHQELLVQTVRQNHRPFFDPQQDLPAWRPLLERLQPPGILPGQPEEAKGLLPAQQATAAALAAYLQAGHKAAILIGEMGTGKTVISAGVVALTNAARQNWKTVVVCPSQVVEKWQREAAIILQNFGVSVHIIGQKRRQPDGQGRIRKVARPVLDVDRAMAAACPGILVVSLETAKNGALWRHAAPLQRKLLQRKVMVEETLPTYPFRRQVEKVEKFMSQVLCCPDCGSIIWDEIGPLTGLEEMGKRRQSCVYCGGALWQQVPFKKGGRIAIAEYLHRRYKNRFSLIIDEAHNTQGAHTDAGYASNDLITAATQTVAMTGSLYNGKASSIFSLLYRLFPDFRTLYDYDETQRFVDQHGLLETITTIETDPKTSAFGYRRESHRIREIPGVSPKIVTTLLEKAAFIKLADLGVNLPEYHETRLPVSLDARFKDGLKQIDTIHESAVKLAREGEPGLLSAWLYASLGWPDCPVDDELEARSKKGELLSTHAIPGILAQANELPADPLPKDRALLELIQAELAQGRGVGVYFTQVNRRDWLGRIHLLLKRHGIYSEVLRQNTCKPRQREQWYRAFVQRCQTRGQNPVLLCNGNLVKEGLDLLALPTLVETGIDYRVSALRQRDRRSWRLGQTQPVKVVFLYYENSWQEFALRFIAGKLRAARLIDGDLIEGLAAMNADEDNLMDALMRAVSQGYKRVGWSGMDVAATSKPTPSKATTSLISPNGRRNEVRTREEGLKEVTPIPNDKLIAWH